MYEIQFHPADIRKQVRYYFLSRSAYRLLVGATVALGVLLATGAVLAPLGLRSLLLSGRLSKAAKQWHGSQVKQNFLRVHVIDYTTILQNRYK